MIVKENIEIVEKRLKNNIPTAADYLDHLISIGIDVTDFENEVISE